MFPFDDDFMRIEDQLGVECHSLRPEGTEKAFFLKQDRPNSKESTC